jgi:hypothetical protein
MEQLMGIATQLKARKEQMDRELHDVLTRFMNDTGLVVHGVDYRALETTTYGSDGRVFVPLIETEVRL